jgi:hypothetical protein
MANGLFTGMLGFNPVDLQQKRMQQFLAPVQQAQNPYERIGAALGTIGGGALFGIEDPQLQRASKIRSIMDSSMQDADLSDPLAYKKSLLTLAQNLKDSGEGDAAMYAMNEAAKIKPEKDKPIVVGRDAALVTSTGEVIYEGPGKETESYRTLSPAENRERGLPANLTFQESTATGKLSQVGTSPAVVFNKPLVGSQTEYAKTVGESAAKRDVKQFEAAETAINNLQKINTTLTELQTSEAITGLGAEIFNNVERFKLLVTANKEAGKKVSDTEYLDALLGSEVFPMIGALDIGARGLDTPPEREFLRKVMTGTIDMNRDTLIRLTKIRKDIEERAIERYNNRVKKGEYKEFFELQNRPPVLFEIPKGPPAPSAAPTGQWRIVK